MGVKRLWFVVILLTKHKQLRYQTYKYIKYKQLAPNVDAAYPRTGVVIKMETRD